MFLKRFLLLSFLFFNTSLFAASETEEAELMKEHALKELREWKTRLRRGMCGENCVVFVRLNAEKRKKWVSLVRVAYNSNVARNFSRKLTALKVPNLKNYFKPRGVLGLLMRLDQPSMRQKRRR